MSDDEADPELLALLRQAMLGEPAQEEAPDTGVLKSAEYIYDNSIDVAIDSASTKAAAQNILRLMQDKGYSTSTWSTHQLHPKAKDESTVNFIFSMNLSNFCFWSEKSTNERFAVEYKGQRWTGYWSLVAALQRALDEDIPITDPHFWHSEEECSDEVWKHVFRSATSEEIPLLHERIAIFREAAKVLYEDFQCRPVNIIAQADGSAARLVNLLVKHFPTFRDEARFEGKTVRFYKRAQILIGDLWACFDADSYGLFHDIDHITMFADYRIPQTLNAMNCLMYSPPLQSAVNRLQNIPSGSEWETQLRGCSIWCVELIRRQILREHPQANVNAILIDFFLYDTIKEKEDSGEEMPPHHRTRSIWY